MTAMIIAAILGAFLPPELVLSVSAVASNSPAFFMVRHQHGCAAGASCCAPRKHPPTGSPHIVCEVRVADIYGKPDIPIPPGYEFLAFRIPRAGDHWISAENHHTVMYAENDKCGSPRIIVKPKSRRQWLLEETDDIRPPKFLEFFVDGSGKLSQAGDLIVSHHPIVRIVQEVTR